MSNFVIIKLTRHFFEVKPRLFSSWTSLQVILFMCVITVSSVLVQTRYGVGVLFFTYLRLF